MKHVRLFILLFSLILSTMAQASENYVVQPHRVSACSGVFVPIMLDHITAVNQQPVRFFDSNGAGLAINDLNNDGLLDVVLANLDGQESILWNEGNLQFRTQRLSIPGKTRGVIIADMNADGWQDIVFTMQRSAPSLWQNRGDGNFAFALLDGISKPAYSMNIGDLDADGDLDMVTASYDAEMERIDASYLLAGGAGVYVYENQDGRFVGTRLIERSQALAIYLADWNGDSRADIAIGNDFAEPDTYWTYYGGRWQIFHPFAVTTLSTMSFAGGDIDNDGIDELYATDMHPYSDAPEIMAIWQPVLADLWSLPLPEGDPQEITNILQLNENGTYRNIASGLGIEHTGWSWSAQFGDLDSDGFLDLYVVNGMMAQELFPRLPNAELVEENQAFRNEDGQIFVPAPEWELNATQSGRGMSMADMDNDGDLDIVINNLLSPAMLYENQLCGGSNLTVDIRQPDTANPQAIGARLILTTSTGVYQREIHAASGYLSGNTSRVHFGFPAHSQLIALEIRRADGTLTRLDSIEANTHLTITLYE